MATPLDDFAHALLRAAGLAELPPDAKACAIGSIREQAKLRIGALAVEQLDDAGLTAFRALMTSTSPPSPEALRTLFASRVANLEEVLRNGLFRLAGEFLAGASRATAASV